jgi:hypothetical protein
MESSVWERATFTVPASVSDERVQWVAGGYMTRCGEHWERMGFRIHEMLMPKQSSETALANSPTAPDRRRYFIWARVSRRPEELHFDVPDNAVGELGDSLKLKE